MIKRWSKRETVILIGLLLAALIVYGITYLNVIKPMYDKSNALEKEAGMYEKQYNKMVERSGDQSDDPENETAPVKIPKQKSVDDILLNLQNIAKSSKVSVDLLTSAGLNGDEDESTVPDGVSSSTYSLEATAKNPANMNAFLQAMENSERLLTMDAMTWNKNGGSVTLDLTFTAYYRSN